MLVQEVYHFVMQYFCIKMHPCDTFLHKLMIWQELDALASDAKHTFA